MIERFVLLSRFNIGAVSCSPCCSDSDVCFAESFQYRHGEYGHFDDTYESIWKHGTYVCYIITAHAL